MEAAQKIHGSRSFPASVIGFFSKWNESASSGPNSFFQLFWSAILRKPRKTVLKQLRVAWCFSESSRTILIAK